MNTETLTKIKTLVGQANALDTVHDRFAETTSDSRCDKHGMGFGVDDRFVGFKVSTSFDSYTGYYGSSGCGTFARFDQDTVRPFIIEALNVHQKAILQTAARLMLDEAGKLTEKAREEIAALQQMVEGLNDPEPEPEPVQQAA